MVTFGSGAGSICSSLEAGRPSRPRQGLWSGQLFFKVDVSWAGTVPSLGPRDWSPRLQISCPELSPWNLSFLSFIYAADMS